eukprot:5654337-Pyramimonas_sp.AAC.1
MSSTTTCLSTVARTLFAWDARDVSAPEGQQSRLWPLLKMSRCCMMFRNVLAPARKHSELLTFRPCPYA